jgi:hypothetical protein
MSMTLARCLGTQPPAQLRSLAKQFGVAEQPNGKPEVLLEAVSTYLKSPDNLTRILDELDESERAALKVITFAGGGSGIVMEQCHQRINQVTGRRRRNGAQVVAGLMGRGMVYVGRAKYRQHYFIPSDLQAPLATLFGQELLGRVIVPGDIEVQIEANDPYAVVRWICQFLAFTRKEEVELTQAGAIYRRTQRQLMAMMGRDVEVDEPPSGAVQDHQYVGLHPDPLDFVFDYCRSRELCEIRESYLVATPRAAEWVRMPLWQRREDLLAFWRESRVSWDVDVQAVLSVLMSLPGDAWVDLKALFREVEPMASDLFRGSLRRRLEQKVVRYLILQGLLTIGESAVGSVCRLTPLGHALLHEEGPAADVEPEQTFFVQPDFEMLVPAHIDTAVLWRIEEIADLEKPDWMMVYRISRSSVYRALRLGQRAQDILAVLERYSTAELPQNVEFSITDWSAAFGRIKFAEAFTMQVDSPALADELMASRTIGRFVLGKLSPTVLIVERKHHADLIAMLEAEGYMPSPGIVELGQRDPWTDLEFTPGGLQDPPFDVIK